MYIALRPIVLLLALLLIVSGCHDSPTEPVKEPPNPTPVQTLAYGAPVDLDSDENDFSSTEVLEAVNTTAITMHRASAEADDWKAADEAIRQLVHTSEPPGFFREQIAGHVMLTDWLLDAEASDEVIAATARYVDLMIENQSPQATTLLPALQRLEGHWTVQRIRQAATVAAEAATAKAQKSLQCTDCSIDQLRAQLPDNIQDAREHRAYKRLHAAAQLRAMQ